MVSSKGDIPDRDDVAPVGNTRGELLLELLERGELQVYLGGTNPETDEPDFELHGYDTHVFARGVVYTQKGDEEFWFFTDDIKALAQH